VIPGLRSLRSLTLG